MNNKKTLILIALAITALIDGSVGQYIAPDDPFPVSSILLMLVSVTLSFMWYYFDSNEIEYRRGKILNISIIALGIIAFPYYFFKSRGFTKGLLYTSVFIILVISYTAIQFIGIYVVYYGFQS